MNPNQLKKLVQRLIDGTLSDQELATLRSALIDFEHDEELIKILDAVWEENSSLDISKEKAEGILHAIISTKKHKSITKKWLGIAASIVVLISIALSLKFFAFQQSGNIDKIKVNTQVAKIIPGKNNAVLTLSNGQKIILNEQNIGELAMEGDVVINKFKDGELSYAVNKEQTNGVLQFNTISTPRGGEYRVILPDGTKVWLNAHSSLRYPVNFTGNERVVEIAGEAYFEVSKNKLKPFRVIANAVEVKVLGTHFNVMAYADEQLISTTLLEGSVNVNNTILVPGQQAQLNKQNNKIRVSKVNTEEVVAWKNGLFIFRNEDSQSIMKKISRWYDVEVIFKDRKLINERFGGTFSRSGELADMLESMSLTERIHFKTEGRRITVMN
ncbi:FecR family protein [Pedobacter insulae]|uniref:FecR protein n=1 Tax=Pedobacter insulae TaxID=414048 RepID=A0A1I2ZQK8_9SPHI|nr:FecR domain-containing protein [Pedobacter insulae]SFH39896.1 FecR protein [Pedobacter insulae]